LALSGAALLTIEATAVTAEGRITYADTGLYSDACEAAMRCTLDSVRRWSDMPIAIQLAHAGRKASTEVPWKGRGQIASDNAHGWTTEAPSPLAFAKSDLAPKMLSRDDLRRLRDAFAASAHRGSILRQCSFTPPMAICCINSFRRSPISATTTTAACSRTECGFRSRC